MKFIVLAVIVSVSLISIAQMTISSLSRSFSGSNPAPIILSKQTSNSQSLEPGVYRTEPYACLVAVPWPQHDDVCAIGGTDSFSKMPISEPDLRFIPILQK
jgi:hypothetical protein